MSNELELFDELHGKITLYLGPVKELTITDKASSLVASGTLKTIADFRKMIEAKRVQLVKPLNDKVDEINAYAKKIKGPIDEAEKFVKGVIADFANAEQKRIDEERRRIEEQNRIEQQRLDAERNKKEEELRKKQEQEAAALRESQEAKRLIEEEKAKNASEAMALFGRAPASEEKIQANINESEAKEAEALKKRQDAERAINEARLQREADEREAALKRQAKQLDAEKPKNIRKDWKWEIESHALIPDQYWQVSEAALTAAVKAGAREIPGVRIFETTTVIAR